MFSEVTSLFLAVKISFRAALEKIFKTLLSLTVIKFIFWGTIKPEQLSDCLPQEYKSNFNDEHS